MVGKMIIEKINSNSIYRTKYPRDCKLLLEKISSKLDKVFNNNQDDVFSPAKNGATCSFWLTEENGKNLQTWEEFFDLLDFIDPHYKNYLSQLNILYESTSFVGMWANQYPRNSYARPHRHTINNDIINVLFYLQKPKNSGDLYLEINEKSYRIGVDEGDIIIFPGGLYHWTDINNSDEYRILVGLEWKINSI